MMKKKKLTDIVNGVLLHHSAEKIAGLYKFRKTESRNFV